MFVFDNDLVPDCDLNMMYVAGRDDGASDSHCRRVILEFLLYHEEQFYQPDQTIINNIYFTPKQFAIKFARSYSVEHSKLSPNQFYEFLKEKLARRYEFEEDQVTFLMGDIKISHQISNFHKDFFAYFFSYRLSKMSFERIKDFVSYQVHHNFSDDLNEFEYFIQNVISNNIGRNFSDNVPYPMLEESKVTAILNCVNLLKLENSINITPTVVGYMIYFITQSKPEVMVKDLYTTYANKFKPEDRKWPETLKTTYYKVKKETSPFHKAHLHEIQGAIDLLESDRGYAKDYGIGFLSKHS